MACLVHVQMLVYEFMPNGTLQDWLSGKQVLLNLSTLDSILWLNFFFLDIYLLIFFCSFFFCFSPFPLEGQNSVPEDFGFIRKIGIYRIGFFNSDLNSIRR